ncbi:MAG: T9SS type A sorting domain-containing protein [bacterium]|nr:MAG: T9SS type A sorting domain-containing protein [bacterium]
MKTNFLYPFIPAIIWFNFAMTQINETKLIPSNGQLNDQFGYAVASDSNYMIIGSPNAPYPYNHFGAVYVYEKTAGVWEEKSRLAASDSSLSASFGCSVSIAGDFILIGAFRDPENGPQSGAAYIFQKDSSGDWTQKQKLLPSDGSAYDEFGTSVALWGDYAIVGAPFDYVNSNETGSAYIFKWNDSTFTWVEKAKLVASNGTGTSPQFGHSVSIYGDYTIIGAYGDEGLANHPGAAYIFYYNGANWIQQAKLNASNVEMNHYFGHSVSIFEDYAVVGSSSAQTTAGGAALIFHRSGTTWAEETMVEGSSSFINSDFGLSVSIDGDYLVVGAPDDDTNGNHSGCAYIFKRNGINWIEQTMLLASDGTEDDKMGWSVFIEDGQIICGAFGQEAGGLNCGAVYVYTGFATDISEPVNKIFPEKFSLEQNYPNPFNPVTTIAFSLPITGEVSLKIFNILGEEVTTLISQRIPAGNHEINWNAADHPSGIYFYRLKCASFDEYKKMVLIK